MYELRPNNRYFQVNRGLIEFEISPRNAVAFVSEVDLTQIERMRASGRRHTYTAFVAKALALAMRDFPYANQRVARRAWLPFLRPRLQRFAECDVAVAVERHVPDAEGVAFVDVLRSVDVRSLEEITAQLSALATATPETNPQWRSFSQVVERAPLWLAAWLFRLPYLAPSLWVKYRGAAALISSPSKYGVDTIVGSWSWPLGVSYGLVKQRAVVRDGQVVACPTFSLIVSFDRRIMAGAPAGRFFARMVEHLEQAESRLL